MHVDFGERPSGPGDSIRFKGTPYLELEPGTIYYYGRLEITYENSKNKIRTIRDLTLYQRACERAPELFRQFEVVTVFEESPGDEPFPPCDELLGDLPVVDVPEEPEVIEEPEELEVPDVARIADAPDPVAEELVCSREKITGSHRVTRVCRTRSQIDEQREEDQAMIRDVTSAPGGNVPN